MELLSYARSNVRVVTDPLAAEARRLRVVEQLSVRDIQARLGIGRNRVHELLRGMPPPEWTRRPNAKDGLRAEAVAFRAEGWSVQAADDASQHRGQLPRVPGGTGAESS